MDIGIIMQNYVDKQELLEYNYRQNNICFYCGRDDIFGQYPEYDFAGKYVEI